MFRPLSITAVLNGWIVTCGCQTVVYQSREQLLGDLNEYLQFPVETERRFLQQAVNRAHTAGPTDAPPPTPAPDEYYSRLHEAAQRQACDGMRGSSATVMGTAIGGPGSPYRDANVRETQAPNLNHDYPTTRSQYSEPNR